MGFLSLHPQPSPVEMGALLIIPIQVSLVQGVRHGGGVVIGLACGSSRESGNRRRRAAETYRLPIVVLAARPVPVHRDQSGFFLAG